MRHCSVKVDICKNFQVHYIYPHSAVCFPFISNYFTERIQNMLWWGIFLNQTFWIGFSCINNFILIHLNCSDTFSDCKIMKKTVFWILLVLSFVKKSWLLSVSRSTWTDTTLYYVEWCLSKIRILALLVTEMDAKTLIRFDLKQEIY